MRRVLTALASMAIVLASGCGSTSCSDACQSIVNCLNRFNAASAFDLATCNGQCQAGTCANKQQLIDCVHGTSCNTTISAYDDALAACEARTLCSIVN